MQCCRCGNVAAILELDENLEKKFRVFEATPPVCAFSSFFIHSHQLLVCQSYTCWAFSHANVVNVDMQESRGAPVKKSPPDYFLLERVYIHT